MTDKIHTISGPDGQPQQVLVRRDKRLKKSARWLSQKDGSILLRIPARLPKRDLERILKDIAKKLGRRKALAAKRTDTDLQRRAQQINRQYFDGQIEWAAIRWVETMKTRLGSCTTGGSTEGHIRISREIHDWPSWVVDYIIAHELSHCVHPNHSTDYWDFLSSHYPRTTEARGFIKGIMFARGQEWDEEH